MSEEEGETFRPKRIKKRKSSSKPYSPPSSPSQEGFIGNVKKIVSYLFTPTKPSPPKQKRIKIIKDEDDIEMPNNDSNSNLVRTSLIRVFFLNKQYSFFSQEFNF